MRKIVKIDIFDERYPLEYNTLVSIIIPTYNSEAYIDDCLRYLVTFSRNAELIIVDGGSDDSTVAIAQEYPVRIFSSTNERAVQMNLGAQKATRDILYFMNAYTFPPKSFLEDIYSCLLQGYDGGCFRISYESGRIPSGINRFFSRFNNRLSSRGDQSLFLFRDLFLELGGFDESMGILEDVDLINRLRQDGSFQMLPSEILVRIRKSENQSYMKSQLSGIALYQMYRLGYTSEVLRAHYQNVVKRLK